MTPDPGGHCHVTGVMPERPGRGRGAGVGGDGQDWTPLGEGQVSHRTTHAKVEDGVLEDRLLFSF